MKQLGQQPRASWFPVIIVGAPSCQTDLLFTKDPVNQKSPSKAFSLNNCVRGIRVFWKRWGVMSWLEQSWLNWESQFKAMTGLGPLTRWWTNALGWVPMSCVHCAYSTCAGENYKEGWFCSYRKCKKMSPLFFQSIFLYITWRHTSGSFVNRGLR